MIPNSLITLIITPSFYQDSDKLKIQVSADLISIMEISEISSIFQIQFYLHFTWYDARYL